jgi:HAD superfamily hydrolase (TIGR01490 family)
MYKRLALFDLDNTLLPTDSDHEWGRFLVRLGVVDAQVYAQANEQFYADYKAGKLDIYGFLRFALAPLAAHSRAQLAEWHQQFMNEVIAPVLRPEALALVQKHQASGDLCCVVTATNSFVTRPIATALGIQHLVATEPATLDGNVDSPFSGEVSGIPNFREGKIERTHLWLAQLGLRWEDFESSTFYSDSMNDLPLLEQVTYPIATNPDARLRAHAEKQGWQILELFL